MARILVVDDEKNIRESLATFFGSLDHDVVEAENGEEALKAVHAQPFDAVLTDYRMAHMNGLELLHAIKRTSPETPVVLMSAFATVENAVAAMKAGAYDYLTKPFSLDQIQVVIERALEVHRLRLQNQTLRDALERVPLLQFQSPAMVELLRTAGQAAASDATVLLSGESGTGKNVIARQIHEWSTRRENAFVVVNCTTLSEQMLESELFGHLRGAFPGAMKNKPGRLEAADGGTVFLDEIADLTPALQIKLVRFLQEHSFERVGGTDTIQVNARIIAASNCDLREEVKAQHFREDLYYRLHVIELRVPPLRERNEDILPLAEWFLRSASFRNRRPPMRISADAAQALKNYNWPGNVRELRNVLERAAVLSRNEEIGREDLSDSIFNPAAYVLSAIPASASLEQVEREHIMRVLAQSSTLEEAATSLGINPTTLWRKRKRYGIE